MNLASISTQLLYTTVPIWAELADGRQSFGTGFIYSVPAPNQPNSQIPLLISNYHVIATAKRAMIELVPRSGDAPGQAARSRVEIPADFLSKHVDRANDLVAVPLGGILTQLEQGGRPVFFRSISPNFVPTRESIEELGAIEDVIFIGYPSGLYDQRNSTPLIRRGITATPVWNDFQGESAFLIDAGVFPGSSGSPVFILNEGAFTTKNGLSVGNRLLFLGVLSQAMLRQETSNGGNVFLGIGKVIKGLCVKEFADYVTRSLLAAA
jgi:S1-C subfamily serine protease